MDLILRRTFPDDRNAHERELYWLVRCEDTTVGSITQVRGAGLDLHWQWSITMSAPPPQTTSSRGSEDSRDAAMAAFRRAFDIYREEIGPEWWRKHLAQCAWLDAQDMRRDGL